jgi:transposase
MFNRGRRYFAQRHPGRDRHRRHKAYDANERLIEPLRKLGKGIVIPQRGADRKEPREYDSHLYKARHLIENFFAKLKQYRCIATRYDKTARNFLGAIYWVASVIWLD